ncbi:lamin tail domain-containing protein [candidate division KSB1 bacterium]
MRKINLLAIMLALILIEPFMCSALRINEIMYNPDGNDNNQEFIEVYLEQETNLTGWVIGDSESDDTLELLQYNSTSNHVLITEEGFDFSGIRATIYSAGASIGNNLGNSADSIYLYDNNGVLMDSVSYYGSIANGNGNSMEFSDGEWIESCEIGGSPGKENCFNNDGTGNINTTNSTNTTNTTIDPTECKAIIVVYTDKEMYNDTDKVNIYFALYNDSFPFTIEYWVEDSIGNIVKSKYNTTNTNTKTWTPSLDEKDGIFYVKSNLYLDCGNETKTGDSESMIIVFNGNAERKTESTILIKEAYLGSDNKIEFGQPLRINVEIYKGDESKSSVEFWVENSNEKVSQTTKALFYDKFTEYDITIPIQLKPNCNNKYPDGAYKIVAEGLDLRAEMTVNIEGITSSLCPSSSSSSSTSSSSSSSSTSSYGSSGTEQKISYQLLNFNSNIVVGEEMINELLIQNDDEVHTFEAWSYIYKGSKSYSGEREGNRQKVELSPGESVIVELNNIVDDAEPGDYKFKVKIKKDNQKTNHEITKEISIKEQEKNNEQIEANKITINEGLKDLGNNSMKKISGNTVYSGSASRSKKLSLVLLLCSIFLIALIGLRSWLKQIKGNMKPASRVKTSKKNQQKL